MREAKDDSIPFPGLLLSDRLGPRQVWNYAKTSKRGAAEVVMFLDDVEIFRGGLKKNKAGRKMVRRGYTFVTLIILHFLRVLLCQ